MLNCVVIKEENVLFDARNKIWKMKFNDNILNILNKLKIEPSALNDEEISYWMKLIDRLELSHDTRLGLQAEDTTAYIEDNRMLVVITPYELARLERRFSEHPGHNMLPILLSEDTIYIGPLTPHFTCYESFIRRAAANNPMLADKLKIGADGQNTEIFYVNKDKLHLFRPEIEAAVQQLQLKQSPHVVWVIEEGVMQQHTFIGFDSASHTPETKDMMNAVDSKLGIITDIKTQSTSFKGIPIYIAVSSTTDYSIYHPDLFAQSNSGAGFDKRSAEYSAVGESIERLAAGCYNDEMRLMSWSDMKEEAVRPENFILFSKEQYESHLFPYRPFTSDTPVNWLKSIDLMTGTAVYIPAACVKLPYKAASGEARITPAISTGLALGRSKEQAILSSIFEVVERDAFSVSWLLQLPPNRRLNVEDYLEGYELASEEHYICNAYDITVSDLFTTVVVTIHNCHSSHFMIGAATRFTVEEAIKKAFLEAVQGITYVDMLVNLYKDHHLITNFNYINTFQKHAAFYSLYPEVKTNVNYFLDEQYSFKEMRTSAFNGENTPGMNDQEKLELAVHTLQKAGFKAYYADLTNNELEQLGVHASRVIIPGLHSLHGSHQFRFLDERRLNDIRDRYSWNGGINSFPHPFP